MYIIITIPCQHVQAVIKHFFLQLYEYIQRACSLYALKNNILYYYYTRRHRYMQLKDLVPPNGDFLLLEIPAIFLVDQDEVQIVAHGEQVVDVAHRRRERDVGEE